MDHDAAVKRAKFIDKTLELRETFAFALPDQVLQAVHVYASDCNGVMLYDLSSQASESYFKAWNNCVKLTWDVPRSTFTYIVENVLILYPSETKPNQGMLTSSSSYFKVQAEKSGTW